MHPDDFIVFTCMFTVCFLNNAVCVLVVPETFNYSAYDIIKTELYPNLMKVGVNPLTPGELCQFKDCRQDLYDCIFTPCQSIFKVKDLSYLTALLRLAIFNRKMQMWGK